MGQGITDWGATVMIGALFDLAPGIDGFWLALLTDEAGEAMDGIMVSDLEPPPTVYADDDDTVGAPSHYARQFIGLGPAAWSLDGDTVTNTTDLPFPIAGAEWGHLDHWALLNAATDGNLYCWSELPEPTYVAADWQVIIPAGGLVLGLVSLDDTYTAD